MKTIVIDEDCFKEQHIPLVMESLKNGTAKKITIRFEDDLNIGIKKFTYEED